MLLTAKPFKPEVTVKTYKLYNVDGSVLIEIGEVDSKKKLREKLGNNVSIKPSQIFNDHYDCFLSI